MPTIGNLLVEPDDGDDWKVDINMRTVERWERTFQGRSFGQLLGPGGMSASAMYELAWTAAKRDGRPLPEKFTEFKDQNEVSNASWSPVVDEPEETDGDPTQLTPSSTP